MNGGNVPGALVAPVKVDDGKKWTPLQEPTSLLSVEKSGDSVGFRVTTRGTTPVFLLASSSVQKDIEDAWNHLKRVCEERGFSNALQVKRYVIQVSTETKDEKKQVLICTCLFFLFFFFFFRLLMLGLAWIALSLSLTLRPCPSQRLLTGTISSILTFPKSQKEEFLSCSAIAPLECWQGISARLWCV